MPSVKTSLCSARTLNGCHGYHPQVQEHSCHCVDWHCMTLLAGARASVMMSGHGPAAAAGPCALRPCRVPGHCYCNHWPCTTPLTGATASASGFRSLLSGSGRCVYSTPSSWLTILPEPRATHLDVSRPSTPTGPRAWMRPVLIPTCAEHRRLQHLRALSPIGNLTRSIGLSQYGTEGSGAHYRSTGSSCCP